MSISNSKRDFLFGRVRGYQPLRPPWAIAEDRFGDTCTRCGDCVRECPTNVIKLADGGFPEMDFSAAGCDFCEVCVSVCEPGALDRKIQPPLNLVANLNDNCFSARGVICRACGEVCDSRAIRFQQVVGGVTHVSIEFSACTGCGECVSICPAHSISIKPRLAREIPA